MLLAGLFALPALAFPQRPCLAATIQLPSITIPSGTPLAVHLVDDLSSSTANVGETFAIVASHDVVVDGWVVIAKGAHGQGEVVSGERAGESGGAGALASCSERLLVLSGRRASSLALAACKRCADLRARPSAALLAPLKCPAHR